MEKSLGLGRKSLGRNADTKKWFWFPIPKCGLGPERILVLNNNTLVFFAHWYWYLFSILQIEYWYNWYFSIWKSYWILKTSIFILCWSGLWYSQLQFLLVFTHVWQATISLLNVSMTNIFWAKIHSLSKQFCTRVLFS